MILKNKVITTTPTLTTTSLEAGDEDGLYVSTATNSGNSTYYFRGNVENNYVSFAGFIWRIVRINEDETVRLIMQDGTSNSGANYIRNMNCSGIDCFYYSTSTIKNIIESWYENNLKNYDFLIENEMFCEQAKVTSYTSGSSIGNEVPNIYTDYVPNYKCILDKNNYGPLNLKVGLITYDEILFSGGYPNLPNDNYYMVFNSHSWTMSPNGNVDVVWYLNGGTAKGGIYPAHSTDELFNSIHPVINVKDDTKVTGSGTSINPYVIQF